MVRANCRSSLSACRNPKARPAGTHSTFEQGRPNPELVLGLVEAGGTSIERLRRSGAPALAPRRGSTRRPSTVCEGHDAPQLPVGLFLNGFSTRTATCNQCSTSMLEELP